MRTGGGSERRASSARVPDARDAGADERIAHIPDPSRLKWTEEKASVVQSPWQLNNRQEIKTGPDSSAALRSGVPASDGCAHHDPLAVALLLAC